MVPDTGMTDDAAAQADWRRAFVACTDRLDTIRDGLTRNTFSTSELLALDSALKVPETMAWPEVKA